MTDTEQIPNEAVAGLLQTDVGKWLLEKHAGKAITFEWNGGGDNGWGDIYINGATCPPEDDAVRDFLVDALFDCLGYGGFDGDFSASGTFTFDPQTGCFEGADNYYTNETATKQVEVQLSVPTDIWFDTVRVHFQSDEVFIDLIVLNGPVTPRHGQIEDALTKELEMQLAVQLPDDLCDDIREFTPSPQDWHRPFFVIQLSTLEVNQEACCSMDRSYQVLEFAHQFKPRPDNDARS